MIEMTLAAAVHAKSWLAASSASTRAGLLRAWADGIEAERAALVEECAAETKLPAEVLQAEVVRTVDQLRFFADVLLEGSYLEVTQDTAVERSAGMHRWMLPVGVVAVFGPSNFPLAYGALGTDVASAVASGCPVVVKAHPSHPRTALMLRDIAARGVRAIGAPTGVHALVEGFDAGAELIADPRTAAVGFVGSVTGGRALFDRCAARPQPIPFYGELGSLNAVVVTPGAVRTHRDDVVATLGDALVTRHGQMCTKPGLLLVPEDDDGLVEELVRRVESTPPRELLDSAVRSRFGQVLARQVDVAGVSVLCGDPRADAREVVPVLLEISATDLLAAPDALMEECFGPSAVVARYGDVAERDALVELLPQALVAGLHGDVHSERPEIEALLAALAGVAGRVVWEAPTTGLRVGWASHHGGGYPASTAAAHTAVGAMAMRRWLRPTSLQGVPDDLLPSPANETRLPRRVDGVMRLGAS